ncbi:b(0,+)-type amino acid transporter 1-like [Hyla sarda]|uniref:b(0,+)-type amino acid transporter 1-like n=1 Tax=Hyla sarda TaxID=327740 RepID=UPI0024C40E16|nr:b(0,+)-type amino acid transporter 1-like [Hyla sarda]XP_056420249.1 b(0,+)-type amino acid transporter 1-like [Hyla sarda]XP_056420250.1 b(0,+)-type amino acid transporter 1-like [Hyla sarda]XP_056420251.1 b(0,+)-type amino acid transporter 1-like [Hyla sarda]
MGIKDPSSTSAIEKMDNDSGKIHLKQELGLISAVSMIAGTMIGSGIFMSPQWVLYYMGSPGASLLIWAACGLLAMLGALSYAELGTVIKESGGEYIYILRNVGPLPAFLLVYSSVIVVRPASIAVVSLSFAEYVVAAFFSDCSSPQVVLKCTAVTCVLVLGIINCLNVRLAMSIMNFFTAAKLIVLVVIIVGGVVLLVKGNTQVLQNAFENTAVGFGPVGVAFYQGLWSYDGWNNLNYMTEELKNPEVNLPRAVMIAIPLVTCIYLLANISYFAAMTPQELLTSDAVAISWGLKVLGTWTWIISLGVALSTFGSANGTLFSGGRVCYKAAMEGHLPDALSMIHVKRLTPSPALIFTCIMSIIMIIPGDFSSIVNFFSFTAWLFYGTTIAGLIYMKIKKPDIPRPYKVPIIIPVIVLIASVYLVLAPVIDSPQMAYLYVVLFILSGVIIYIPVIHYKWSPGWFHSITLHLQLLLQVAPTDKND